MALFLSEQEVRELLPMEECIEVLDRAFSSAGRGLYDNKPRSRIRLPKGFLHFMAAYVGLETPVFGYKSYVTFPRGGDGPLVMLYHGETGELLSAIEAGSLGQIRTGAASGLATRYMARTDASTVGIVGTGFQAATQLEAVCAVRNVTRARVYSRNPEKCHDFAQRMGQRLSLDVVPVESAEECVRGADIAITITTARVPVLEGDWLDDGAHVNAAGGNHWMRRELDDVLVERAGLIVVDDLEQAKLECGDLIWSVERGMFRWSMAYELRDVVSGRTAGRPSTNSITLFESQGVAIQDVAAAWHVYNKARDRGIGKDLPF